MSEHLNGARKEAKNIIESELFRDTTHTSQQENVCCYKVVMSRNQL